MHAANRFSAFVGPSGPVMVNGPIAPQFKAEQGEADGGLTIQPRLPNGTAPLGDRWAAQQAEMTRWTAPYGQDALNAAAARRASGRWMGCGCGDTSLALARSVGPAGAVLGVDIARQMLDVARRRALDAGLSQLTFAGGRRLQRPPAAGPGPHLLPFRRDVLRRTRPRLRPHAPRPES